MTHTPESLAAQKLLQRHEARQSLASWAKVCGFEPAKHHLLLIDKLEAVVRGDIKKLMIFLPPGSAKSTYSSVLFPPWYLAQKKDASILTASHSADLATFFGRRSRNLIQDKEKVLGYALRKDSQAADEWTTNNGGVFFCAGVGGRIAGRRADLGLIDDPVGSKEDAYSKVIRDGVWDWFRFDFRTRLKPNAATILIMTRWHEDDLAGRLLAAESGEWTVVNLPMVAKENDAIGRPVGELLWPEYFTEAMLAEAQKDRSIFSALYQQDPTPEDGDYFRKHWIEDHAYDKEDLPNLDECVIYATSDHAVSEREAADSTVLLPVAVDSKGVSWILPDVFWDKVNSFDGVEAMLAMMKRRAIRIWWAEQEKISKSFGPFLRKEMRDRGIFCYIEEVRPARDKQTRAQSIRGRMQAGMVRFPRFAPWYQKAVEQLLKFPAGSHDDFVDALAYIGLGLDSIAHGNVRKIDTIFSEKLLERTLTLNRLKEISKRSDRLKKAAYADN